MTNTPVYQLIISDREAIDRALRADLMAMKARGFTINDQNL